MPELILPFSFELTFDTAPPLPHLREIRVVARGQVLCPKTHLYLSVGSERLPSARARLCVSPGGEGSGAVGSAAACGSEEEMLVSAFRSQELHAGVGSPDLSAGCWQCWCAQESLLVYRAMLVYPTGLSPPQCVVCFGPNSSHPPLCQTCLSISLAGQESRSHQLPDTALGSRHWCLWVEEIAVEGLV